MMNFLKTFCICVFISFLRFISSMTYGRYTSWYYILSGRLLLLFDFYFNFSLYGCGFLLRRLFISCYFIERVTCLVVSLSRNECTYCLCPRLCLIFYHYILVHWRGLRFVIAYDTVVSGDTPVRSHVMFTYSTTQLLLCDWLNFRIRIWVRMMLMKIRLRVWVSRVFLQFFMDVDCWLVGFWIRNMYKWSYK